MELTGKKILVTGGAGFIGSHLVDALAKTNLVTVVDNLSSGSWQNIGYHSGRRSLDLVKADIRDADRMAELMMGKEVVFHLAVQCLRVSLMDPMLVHEVNATGTLNLCMAAAKNEVKRFVYVSSSEVYGTARKAPMDEEHTLEPTTPYGASKLAGEAYARSYYLTFGLPATIVRPFNSYGPREHMEGSYGEVIPRFVLRCLNGLPPVIFGDGEQTRDFTEVSDTVRGLIQAAECEALVGETVNIAAGCEVSINDIARMVIESVGADVSPVHMEPRPGDVRRHWADISKARNAFNYSPRIGIEEGIRNYVGWLKSQGLEVERLQRNEVLFNWLAKQEAKYGAV